MVLFSKTLSNPSYPKYPIVHILRRLSYLYLTGGDKTLNLVGMLIVASSSFRMTTRESESACGL